MIIGQVHLSTGHFLQFSHFESCTQKDTARGIRAPYTSGGDEELRPYRSHLSCKTMIRVNRSSYYPTKQGKSDIEQEEGGRGPQWF